MLRRADAGKAAVLLSDEGRSILHNMALMSPATTAADVDRHTEVFRR